MYPHNNRQSCSYQQAFHGGGGLRSQPSIQPYSELKCDFSEDGSFRLKMCVIVSVGFVLNLIFTFSLMTFLLWPHSPRDSRGDGRVVGCDYSGNFSEPIALAGGSCFRSTKEAIRKSVLEDCEENSHDEIRTHLTNCQNLNNAGSILTRWETEVNRSSVTLAPDGQFTVNYSGIYILQSSLAFECRSEEEQPKTDEKSYYWQEIQVRNVVHFRDAERIKRQKFEFRPAFCYRSYIYAVLKLRAKDYFRVLAGPAALMQCTRKMSYLALYRL